MIYGPGFRLSVRASQSVPLMEQMGHWPSWVHVAGLAVRCVDRSDGTMKEAEDGE